MKLEDLENIDKEKMFQIYDNWPEIARYSYEKKIEKLDFKDIDHVVFAGMGGSGSIGDCIGSILSKEDIHISNIKGYLLPKTVDSKTLIIATSVSGDTIETLSILKSAMKTKAKTIAFSSGGLLKKHCTSNNIQFQEISMKHSPRASFTSFLYSILNCLEPIIPIKQNDVLNSINELEKTKEKIFSGNLNSEQNISLNLAEFMKEMICIYYPAGLQSTAIRFKNCLQENAKMHATSEDIIEACHNSVVSWERRTNVKPILIKGKDDYIKTTERQKILEDYFEKEGIEYRSVNSVDGDILSKITNLIYLLDYSTIYAAVLNKINPSPVRSINYIKSRL